MDNIINPHEIIVKTFTAKLALNKIFSNDNPCWLEIGFGVGKFFLTLAVKYPDVNFIGIEYSKFRYFKMKKKIVEKDLKNIRIMNVDASVGVKYLFHENTFEFVFINFPDPWPKSRHEKNRLLAPEFAVDLSRSLKPDALVRVLTDVRTYSKQISESMTGSGCFERISRFIPEIEKVTTTFQDRFESKNLPVYKMMFIKK